MKIQRRTLLKTMAALTGGALLPASKSSAEKIFSPRAPIAKANFHEWESELDLSKGPTLKARLLANENPYGPSDITKQAISNAISKGNRYGHAQADELISLLADKEGVPKEYIMLGPGSSDLLEKVGITHFIDGGNIVAADPTYMSIIKTANSFGAEWKKVPVLSNWEYDLDAMKSSIDSETKLVYICNPNNPSGTITPAAKIKAFCKDVSSKVPVFVDEAYLEFMSAPTDKSMVGLLNENQNVIISRTFSKVYGMAGIRVGYIVALPSTLEKISDMVRSNMGLNITALYGALAAVKDDEFIASTVRKNAACREYVFNELKNLDIEYVPSQTSFILFPIEQEGKPFLKEMLAHQIGVRSFTIFDQTYCRVSMGTMQEMKLFTDALKKVIS